MPSIDLAPAAASASTEALGLLLALAVLLAAAKLLGEVSLRLGQPAILGELLAGLLLGPSLLNLPVWSAVEGADPLPTVHILAQLGVLWLMFGAGLEIELSDFRRAGRPAAVAGGLGVVFPLLLGTGLALLAGFPLLESIFLGVVMSATSVSISAQTLLELNRLRTPEGIALLGAAVIDDVLVIVLLSAFVTLAAGSGGLGAVLAQLGVMALTLAGVGLFSLMLLPRLVGLSERLRVSEGLLAIVLASVLLVSWATEAIGGMAAITGAFLAGVGLGRGHWREDIERGLHRLGYAFFVPLFLVDIGLRTDVRLLDPRLAVFTLGVVVVAVVSKILGSGLGAWIGGFDRGAALRMGLGMVSRGEVGLIVAGVGVAEGFLEGELFVAVVVMVLATTLLTPILLRSAYSRQEA
jgi:Kef-type K+ transport system membrane component KefB